MNATTSAKTTTTTTTLVVAVSASEIASTTTTTTTIATAKTDNNSTMPSRVPLLATVINCDQLNQTIDQLGTNLSKRSKRDQKGGDLGANHLQMMFTQNHQQANYKQHGKISDKLNTSHSTINQINATHADLIKDHKLHYQEEFNKMRERLFRLLSKVPIQVETVANNDTSTNNSNSGNNSILATCSSASASSSSSSSQSQNSKKINREPLLIKYYNERSMTDILDQHFGCSLIKHNYELGVHLDQVHLFRGTNAPSASNISTTTSKTFNNLVSAPDTRCDCTFSKSDSRHNVQAHSMDAQIDHNTSFDTNNKNIECAPIKQTYDDTTIQALYETVERHPQNLASEWQPLLVKCTTAGLPATNNSNWQMQLPLYCAETIKSQVSNNKSMSNQRNQSAASAHKEARFKGKSSTIGHRVTDATKRPKRSSASSIIASRTSQATNRPTTGGEEASSRTNGGSDTRRMPSNGQVTNGNNSAVYFTASDFKQEISVGDNKTGYMHQEAPQTVGTFAIHNFAPLPDGCQSSDMGSLPLNTAANMPTSTNFVSPTVVVEHYQSQPDYNHQHHQHLHQHHHQLHQHQQQPHHHHQHLNSSHQNDLHNLYSSPTNASNYQLPGLDPASGNPLVEALGPINSSCIRQASQSVPFSDHRAQKVPDSQQRLQSALPINASFGQNHHHQLQQQLPHSRQVETSYGQHLNETASTDGGRCLLAGEAGAYYQPANDGTYQQPVVDAIQQDETWQQLGQSTALSIGAIDSGRLNEQSHLQQHMIDQQQHLLNNGFINNSESYNEHDISFYLAPNANAAYMVYTDSCHQAAPTNVSDNLTLSPHHLQHDLNQIQILNNQHPQQQQHLHQHLNHHLNHQEHHHLNHHSSISRLD